VEHFQVIVRDSVASAHGILLDAGQSRSSDMNRAEGFCKQYRLPSVSKV